VCALHSLIVDFCHITFCRFESNFDCRIYPFRFLPVELSLMAAHFSAGVSGMISFLPLRGSVLLIDITTQIQTLSLSENPLSLSTAFQTSSKTSRR